MERSEVALLGGARSCPPAKHGALQGRQVPALRVARRVLTDQDLTTRAPRDGAAMPDHHPQRSHTEGPPPTARQQHYLRQLALQRGISYTTPRTRAQASRLIDQLKRRAPEPHADRRREIRAVQDDMARGRGDSARIVEGVETTGYGSTATWKQRS